MTVWRLDGGAISVPADIGVAAIHYAGRIVVRADEKLTVFAELESAVRACAGRITSDEKEIAVLGSLEEGCSVVLS